MVEARYKFDTKLEFQVRNRVGCSVLPHFLAVSNMMNVLLPIGKLELNISIFVESMWTTIIIRSN